MPRSSATGSIRAARQEDTRARVSSQTRYLHALERTGTLTSACKAARIRFGTVYVWRETDLEFSLAEQAARNAFADGLEEEAIRRARLGVLRPVYQMGQRVGFTQEYSDSLLLALLKAHRPDKYRERVDLNVAPVIKQVAGFDPADVL